MASTIELDDSAAEIAHVGDGGSDFIAQQVHGRAAQQLRGNRRKAFPLMVQRALLALHVLDGLGLVFDDCQNRAERHEHLWKSPKLWGDIGVRRNMIQQHSHRKNSTPAEKS